MSIKPRKELENLVPYKASDTADFLKDKYGFDRVLRHHSNESPIPTSPKVLAAIHKTLEEGLMNYPDAGSTKLRQALAEKNNLPMDYFTMTNGADELLVTIANTFLEKGDEAILSEWTFVRYDDATNISGATIKKTPMIDFQYDLEALLQLINEKTKLIWLCNPNNPTGSMISEKDLIHFLDNVPDSVLVVYDEAYSEFADDKDFPHHAERFLATYKNLLLIRTFSKVYGLANLRIGYAIADPEIILNIDKVRIPFNVSTLAQNAALAALEDLDYVAENIRNNTEQKNYFYREFERLGLRYYETQANHMIVKIPMDSFELAGQLKARGILIAPRKDNYIRVSIASPEDNQAFIRILGEVLEQN